jgi:hypothetical protein
MFNQLKDQTVVKKPGDVDGIQFAIRYLENCNASLYDYSAQVSLLKVNAEIGHGGLMQKFYFDDWAVRWLCFHS